jgi:deoxyribonuclease-4
VNDADAPLGSNRDRHASLGVGVMKDGIGTFVAHPAFETLPAILETHGPDGGYAGELRRLRELHRKGRRRLAARARRKA